MRAPVSPRPAITTNYTLTGTLTSRTYAKTGKRLGAFVRGADLPAVRDRVVSSYLSAAIRTPDYWSKVNNDAFIPPTPANGYRNIVGSSRGKTVIDYGSVVAFRSGFRPWDDTGASQTAEFYDLLLGRGTFSPSLSNRALIQARLKLKEQAVNLAQAFAERAQTAKLLSDTLGKVVRCISNLRRGRFRAAVAALELPGTATRRLSRSKSTADNWLALQYGWKPLLSDLYGSAEELRRRDELFPDRYRLFMRTAVSEKAVFKPKYYGNGVIAQRDEVLCVGQYNQKAKIRLDYVYNPASVLTIAKRTGFTNPALLAWELTLFSFVADWFFPFGDYLSQLDATIGMSFLGGSLTERWECKAALRLLKLETATAWNSFDVTTNQEHSAWRRTVYTNEPFPGRPSFKNPLSAVHVANASALLVSLRKLTR